MPDITDAFSPPYACQLFDGRSVHFKRMLSRQWSELIAQIRVERLEKAMIQINKDLAKEDWRTRQTARLDAEDQIRQQTTIKSVAFFVVNDIDGIERLLKFAAIQCGTSESEWEAVKDMIPPLDKVQIADEIVYMPIKPTGTANPQTPDGGEQSATAGQSQPTT